MKTPKQSNSMCEMKKRFEISDSINKIAGGSELGSRIVSCKASVMKLA